MKMKKRKSFLAEKVIGLILRVYSSKEEDVRERVEMIHQAIRAARRMMVDGTPIIRRIDVLVWADKAFPESDCGQTALTLQKEFWREKDVFVSEVRHADIFCGILNYGIVHQLRKGVDYSIIVSAEAFSYMTPETAERMIDAACAGARAIGVALNELTESILAGRIANTLAMWHNESLMTVGGFDLRAAKPIDERFAHYMKGWNKEKGTVFYHLAGVEEVIPLARMVDIFGPCIAPIPIMPEEAGGQAYIAPDPGTQPDLWARHISKMGTKLERQCALLASIGYDISYLRGGVMEQFR